MVITALAINNPHMIEIIRKKKSITNNKSCFYELIEIIKDNIMKNEWHLARIQWLRFSNFVQITKDQNIIYNCFSSEYESYYSSYSKYQNHSWSYSCNSLKCKNSSIKNENSSAFILK